MRSTNKFAFASGLFMASLNVAAQEAHLIQSNNYETLPELLKQIDAPLTDAFPLISAVGTRLTEAQADWLAQQPGIIRVIDNVDDALGDQDSDDNLDTACPYAGSIKLNVEQNQLIWPIHARIKRPTRLHGLEITQTTGDAEIRTIALDGRIQTFTQSEETGTVTVPINAKLSDREHRITITFAGSDAPNQNDLDMSLTFDNDCETALLPAYTDQDSNTYFNDLIGASSLHKQGIKAQGVGIAVLDSGLWSHPDLDHNTDASNRVPVAYDAIRDLEVATLTDESGHGTHITSVIANSATISADEPSRYQGVAPDALIIPVKAFDANGKAQLFSLLRALQWIADNQAEHNIRVLNLSFASKPRWPYWLDPVNQAIIQLWHRGVTAVAAVGNSGPDPITIGAPANIPYIIGVGAYTDSWTPDDPRDDFVPLFSSQGPTPLGHIKPDIIAPGGHIEGLTPAESRLAQDHPDFMLETNRIAMTGTSQAAGVVSGAIALMLQISPELTPDEIKCKLMSSAKPGVLPNGKLAYSPLRQGAGMIDIARAISIGNKLCANGQDQLLKEINREVFFTGPAELDTDGSPFIPNFPTLFSTASPGDTPVKDIAWGVKEHVERLQEADVLRPNPLQSTWVERYFNEIELLKSLSNQ